MTALLSAIRLAGGIPRPGTNILGSRVMIGTYPVPPPIVPDSPIQDGNLEYILDGNGATILDGN